MRRIGVLGGSFDPVHLAHLIVAEAAADRLELDEVWFIPTEQQPFKPAGHVANTAHRVAMLRLAVEDEQRFSVDLHEVSRGGVSYTVDTLAELRREFPGDELFLLVGSDVASDLERWRDAERIADLAVVVALSRAGVRPPDSPLIAQVITVPSVDLSASVVRQAVGRGEPTEGMVPPSVADYIRLHRLYENES